MENLESKNAEIEIAEQLIEKKNYQGAEQILQYLLSSNHGFLEARNDLAVVYILTGRPDMALEQIRFVLELDTTNEIALGNLEYLKANYPRQQGIDNANIKPERIDQAEPADDFSGRQITKPVGELFGVGNKMLSGGKETIVIFANCQGGWFYNKLNTIPKIRDIFDIKYMPNFDHPSIKPGNADLTAIKKCKYLISQVAVQYPEFKYYDKLPRNCNVIKIPALAMNVLWPFQQPDPRSKPEPGFEYGRFPYGDSILNECIAKEMRPGDIVDFYVNMDLNKRIDLNRYLELYWEETEYMDTLSDIRIYPVIQKKFREVKLYDAINHPKKTLMWDVFKPIEDYILLSSGLGTDITNYSKFDYEIGDVEIPIHPFIIKQFNLKWADENTKYRFRNSFLTFEEYIYKYINFEVIK